MNLHCGGCCRQVQVLILLDEVLLPVSSFRTTCPCISTFLECMCVYIYIYGNPFAQTTSSPKKLARSKRTKDCHIYIYLIYLHTHIYIYIMRFFDGQLQWSNIWGLMHQQSTLHSRTEGHVPSPHPCWRRMGEGVQCDIVFNHGHLAWGGVHASSRLCSCHRRSMCFSRGQAVGQGWSRFQVGGVSSFLGVHMSLKEQCMRSLDLVIVWQ